MIDYVQHKDIDKIKWDGFISSSPQSSVYAYSWFLDIVSPGWDALIEDDHRSAFPLTCRKKAGIHYLFQPHFTQHLGLFTGDKIITVNKLREFIDAIPDKFRLTEIQLNPSDLIDHIDGYTIKNRITCHLELGQTYEKIFSGYSENLKRNIKKAQKSQLRIVHYEVDDDIVGLFRQNRGAGIQQLKTEDYKTLLELLSEARKRELLKCKAVLNSSGKLIAGAMFIRSPHSYIFMFSATGDEARETGAMSALIDSFIQEHSGKNLILDFEGSMDKDLARFYKSFGSQEIVYLQILKNNLPLLLRWLK